jgi:exosortase D (VPLPA-CTERM-specific)
MGIAAVLIALVVIGVWQHEALSYLVYLWNERLEFSHGPLLPLVALWVAWRKRDALAIDRSPSAFWGAAIVIVGAITVLLGDLSALMAIVHYGLAIMLCGLIVAWIGPRAAKQIWLSFALIFAAIPPPNFILNNLSVELQLVSSSIGLMIMRALGITVFVEGNVIDLGEHQLEVAAACDGLRYLFPLITLAFMMAYFYRAAFWKRAIVFLASVPISIFMNGIRVGLIGVLVEHYGMGMAEGFFHEFQGWVMFMLSAGMLLGVVILLSKLGSDKGPWRERFGIDSGSATPVPLAGLFDRLALSRGLTVASVCAIAIAGAGLLIPQRVEATQPRASLVEFPMMFGAWQGRRDALDRVYIDELKFDDYLLADFRVDGKRSPVNLYVAYYDSQRKGESAHSPRSCIPGGGWDITSFSSSRLAVGDSQLPFNRVVIENGTNRQVVYYWFAQRGRIVTNEYLVKWYIFWDSLTRNRTDGAMIRLVAAQQQGQTEEDVDRTLQEFARTIAPKLATYIPG